MGLVYGLVVRSSGIPAMIVQFEVSFIRRGSVHISVTRRVDIRNRKHMRDDVIRERENSKDVQRERDKTQTPA